MRSSIVPRQTNLCTSTLLLLADAEGAVGGLILHGGIPPAVEVDHMRGGGEIQPRAAGLEREHEERRQFVLLKALDQFAALGHRRAAMQHQTLATEDGAEKGRQRLGGFAKLGEHQHLFLLGGDHLGQLAQAGELAAVVGAPGAIAQPLRGMVADLLEAHQEGEHHALATDAFGIFQRARPVPSPRAGKAPPAPGSGGTRP